MSLKFLLIQLNEINFDLVDKYLSESKKKNQYINLKKIKHIFKCFNTYAENKYEELEPWIQWASVNLGKDYDKHKIFRLGDIVNSTHEVQIYETIEQRGFRVGAISPINTDNRLKNPLYFLPDPWTDTNSDSSNFSKRLSYMLKQSVNDNSSGKLSFKSISIIIEIIIKTFHFKKTFFLFQLIFSSLKKPWLKSLVLDYLIHLVHLYFIKKKNPNFSSIFFNGGAHIQHHYFFNAKHIKNLPKNPKWYIKEKADPIEDMLKFYDKIIGDYLYFFQKNDKLMIATGLRQVPYNMTKFYYRIKNHVQFLNKIGVNYSKVLPRMTRDFEIIFDNKKDLKSAKIIFQNIKTKKKNLEVFKEIEERDKSLFITLTHPNEIRKDDIIVINNKLELNFYKEIVFVAIKNGMHDSKGYVFCSPNLKLELPNNPIKISKLHNIILSNFEDILV